MNSARNSEKPPKPEVIPCLAFTGLALALSGLAFSRWGVIVPLRFPLFTLAAGLFIASAGFCSVALTALARRRGPLQRRNISRGAEQASRSVLKRVRRAFGLARNAAGNIDWRGDWLPLLSSMMLNGAAVFCLWQAWRLVNAVPPTLRFDEWTGGALVGASFLVLVLERRFSGLSERTTLSAPALTRLVRLLMVQMLGLALCYSLFALGLTWAIPVERAVLLFSALVACEFMVRASTYLFMPLPALESRAGHADSLVLGLLRLQRPSLRGMNAAISRQFGIDLGRSWALEFIRRAAIPAAIGLAVFAWLLTGVSALDLSQRAAYEAFGRPQTVFHSGLHVYLPWPFGRLRPIEYGVVHEIPIVFASEDGTPPEVETTSISPDAIEGVPPASADRLWDASHPSEASYLVASNRNGRENFEIVNIDLQILYRIGLSDTAAYQSLYGVDAPDALIRAAAGRMLARYFARYTMNDVLGQNRELFIRGFQKELQSRLDALSSGVEIIGVVIEAIHPPPAAATAYQDVQAAQIRSEIQVADARAQSISTLAQAQASTIQMKDAALADAEEVVDQAKLDTALFTGDVAAYRQDGAAFLFERRLTSVKNALQNKAFVTVIDSRIAPNQMPMLDYRGPGARPFVPPPPPLLPSDPDSEEQ